VQEILMASIDENILKAAKEIVVKFIECGRLSPNAFPEAFQSIYRTIADTVKSSFPPAQTPPAAPPPAPLPPAPAQKPPATRR
jgi:hypothetical protein